MTWTNICQYSDITVGLIGFNLVYDLKRNHRYWLLLLYIGYMMLVPTNGTASAAEDQAFKI